jgi:hypothetical protein
VFALYANIASDKTSKKLIVDYISIIYKTQ